MNCQVGNQELFGMDKHILQDKFRRLQDVRNPKPIPLQKL